MQPMSPPEALKLLAKRLRELPPKGLNEANTRLQFIDTTLEHVLGWRLDDFNAEEHVASSDGGGTRSEWLDYHLRAGDRGWSSRQSVVAKPFNFPPPRSSVVCRLGNLSTTRAGRSAPQ